ncbi:MAG: glucosamine-6-phosphate deaminase [Pirellulaceae bacterium]
MRVVITSDIASASSRAADHIQSLIRQKSQCVLGLATGSSPLATYQELIRRYDSGEIDFSCVTTFNLDEYVGLPPTHPQSYRHFMQENLFRHINIPPQNTNIPDGRSLNFRKHCEAYEQQIVLSGGIDLQLLGLGADGHIAFNEPGSSLGSRTRIKTLTRETIDDNARFFDRKEDVPKMAITMGVGTILDSRQCLLLAFGKHKAEAVAATIEGPVTSQVTASALQMHRDVIVILDEDAAGLLRRRDYYDQVEMVQRELEQSQMQSELDLKPGRQA